LQERHGDCTHTLEMEFAWEGSEANSKICLAACPVPLTR
jgi:hypothetical protein